MAKGKGGKNKKRGKKNREGVDKRQLLFKDEGQEYAQVVKMLGNGRLEAMCADGTVRLCHIRGKFKKRVWINAEDIIMLGLREFEDEKADVIHKYTPEEARTLQAYGELPSGWMKGGGETEADDEEGIAFGGAGGAETESSEENDEGPTTTATMEELLEAL